MSEGPAYLGASRVVLAYDAGGFAEVGFLDANGFERGEGAHVPTSWLRPTRMDGFGAKPEKGDLYVEAARGRADALVGLYWYDALEVDARTGATRARLVEVTAASDVGRVHLVDVDDFRRYFRRVGRLQAALEGANG